MHAAVVRSELDVGGLMRRVGAPADGAVLVFLGIVRDRNEGRSVSGMEYEAYEEMAQRVLQDVAAEAAGILGTDRIAVEHRTGVLEVGETSVAIAVSSPHRDAAYRASRYVIEEIKKRLPVWKREHYVDGERTWLPGHTPSPGPSHQGAGPHGAVAGAARRAVALSDDAARREEVGS